MGPCFRIALWMFLLTGYLQARPTGNCFNMMDLGFDRIRDVSCKNNVTFTAPTNKERACQAKAIKFFEEGMNVARMNSDDSAHISNTLEALSLNCLTDTQTNCNFTFKVHTDFRSFVNATEAFVQWVNVDRRSPAQ